MLRHAVITRLVLLLVFALCQVSNSKPLITSPNETEVIIQEGSLLEITCISTKPIKLVYPNTSENTNDTLEKREMEENGVFKLVLQRYNIVFSDTGWYGCADINFEISSFNNHLNDDDDSEVNWLYVYVESLTNLFTEENSYVPLNALVGDNVIFPCRTTSPSLTPILISETYDPVEEERTSYDPRIGFTLKNLTVRDSELYKCKVEKNNITNELDYILSVHLKQRLPVPNIHDESLRHVTRGTTLSVNCSVDIDMSMTFVLKWKTPKHLQNSSRISTKDFSDKSPIYRNNRVATTQLTIRNVTDDDAGEYMCFIQSIHETKHTFRTIMIHDPEIKYINLTSQHSDTYYEARERESVQWVVYVDGYPKPHIQWFNPDNKEIEKDTKYDITTTTTMTILKIQSLKVEDAGNYMLQATNEYVIKQLNFTLVVMAKPISFLRTPEIYYAPSETAELYCEVMGFPRPVITWTFLQCPNYPSLENSQDVQLADVKEVSDKFAITSIAKLPITMSGKLTCLACNDLDCDSATENILVSDGVGAIGIIGPSSVTKGDNVELICAASVYNYTENLNWLNETNNPINETERIQIMRHKTQFTYRSTLKINNVKKSDAQVYTCIGQYVPVVTFVENPTESITRTLEVLDPKVPYFTLTNMNQSKTEINLIEERHKTIILKCFADGMPKPNISWYKDNVPLKENDQYFFKYQSQELNIKYINESGKYSCRASNRVGVVETYQEIIVTTWQQFDIILTAVIVIMTIFVIILMTLFMMKVRREKMMKKALMETGLMHFEEGALECLNPELTVDDQAELLPYDKKWEFPRERLKLGKQLGSGAFGVVMKAEAEGICEEETVTTVAVKMVRRTTDPTYVRALASELKIMVHLGKHLNVVNLLGACTKNIAKRELLVIVEYCRFGNLHNYLLRHRSNFINQIDPKTGKLDLTVGTDMLTRTASVSSNNRIKYAALSFSRSTSANSVTDTVVHYSSGTGPDSQEISYSPDGCLLSNNSSQPGWRSNYRGDYKENNLKPICTQDLLSYAFQVARGMEYLSQRRVLHGDLAARNILLAEDNVVKICDFGLAKTVYKDGNYKKKGDGPLPIKWMAIESIRDRIFSTETDVWSFGIVLWEFFTLAETPYPGMEAEKQYQKLIEGYRMEQPEYALREVYDIMLKCWKAKPALRPTFTDLVNNIGDLLEESVKSHYITLNTPYMDMNTMNLEGKNDYLTMMSAPTHAALSSPSHDYVNSPFSEGAPDSTYLCMRSPGCQSPNESGIFSPRPHQDGTRFEFPAPASDGEDAVEISPMLKHEEDPYLKPINVHERRAEFARQRQAMKNQAVERPIDRDSGYCNAPRNLHLIDLNDADEKDRTAKQGNETTNDAKKIDYTPSIIRTQDNYVNMPKQKSDLVKKGIPDAFSNPSYVMMSNREMDQMA